MLASHGVLRSPLLVLPALLLSLAVGSAAARPPGVSLATGGAGQIRIAVNVPPASLTTLTDSTGVTHGTRLSLEGYDRGVDPDAPWVPGCVVALAVPPLGDVRVSASASEPQVREGVDLVAGSGLPSRAAAPGARPGVRARLLEVGWMRNQRIARVALFPADYDAAARRLTLYSHLDVDVLVQPSADLGPPAESPDPFEGVYRGALLNYEQGRAWRRPATRRLVPRAAAGPTLPTAAFAEAVPETSVYAGRMWVKIAVQKCGFYKVDFGKLRTLALFDQDTTTASDDLRLFHWPGVPVLPVDSYCDSCDYREVAIGVVDHDDGTGRRVFGRNTDYFYFYAMGASDWASLYDPSRPDTVYVDHPYETKNYYYLTRSTVTLPVGGTPARIGLRSGAITDPGLPTPATFPARAHFEQELEYFPNATPLYGSNDRNLPWVKWFWRSITQGGTFTVTMDLPGADTTQALRLRALIWGLSHNVANTALNIYPTIPDHYLNVSFNGTALPKRIFNDLLAQVYDTQFSGASGPRTSGNVFTMSLDNMTDPGNPQRLDQVGLAWIDLYYPRTFQPVNDELAFDTPAGGNGDVVYRVGPFTRLKPPRIFDVTRALSPVEVTDAVFDTIAGQGWVRFHALETEERHYRVLPDSLITVPAQSLADAPGTSLENLRSPAEQADYIVVYYDGFQSAADQLVSWRRDHLPLAETAPPYATKAVPISALYDQFSGGRTDPAAIRNFLRAAYYNWNGGGSPRRPTYVTLLGGASYDFKNILGRAASGQPGALVPSYEDNFDGSVDRQYATDDWLLNVDNAAVVIPDFLGGRLPMSDLATAEAVVSSKVVGYEQSPALGEWRNKVMLVADDNMQGPLPDPLNWDHLEYTSILDESYTPQQLDRAYVYLNKYPTTSFYSKPEAKADIVKNLDDGVALMNYVGHGSPFQLADERVLIDTDVGALSSTPRFSVIVSASCDVGKFDDPTVPSLGQQLVDNSVGGAAAVVSATELAFSDANYQLNRTIFQELFRRDSVDCHFHLPVAAALLATKQGSTNNQKYQLMGDAAIGISLPRLWVEMTVDSAGQAVGPVRRGQTLDFRGRVLTCPGGEPVPLDGVASLLIEDSQEVDSIGGFTYRYKAGAIYRGDVGVTNGELHGQFTVPLEARDGPLGRVRAYVQGRAPGEAVDTDGSGSLAALIAPGVAPAGDDAGPRITLSFVGGSTTVRPDATLKIDLSDPSGILTTDHIPQNGIVVTLDGNSATREDVTESFRYAADSHESGMASYQLPKVALGAHRLTVSAADNLAAGLSASAHRSSASLDFTVVNEPELRIAHAYLFPNPTESGSGRGGGMFVVDAPGDSVNLLLRIYTNSGRLIRTLKVFGGQGQLQVPWDGLDDEGQALANGVYFFYVHVNPRDADGTSSPRQKADADGRFVIVNRR